MVSLESHRTRRVLVPVVLLAPATAWLFALVGSYVIHDFVCIATATAATAPPSAALQAGLVVLNVALFVATIVAGALAVIVLRSSRRMGDDLVTAPARFVGVAGIGMAVLFAFGIALIATTPTVVGAC